MRLELRVAISPTPSFCNQVLLQAASLRRFYPDAIVRAYVGHADPTPEMHALIESEFAGHRIGFEWVTGREFTQFEGTRAPYLATMNRRWQKAVGDVVIISDADVIFTGTLDDILARDTVQGVQAHVPPLPLPHFAYLFQACGTFAPSFDIPYTGAGFMAHPDAIGPSYPNSGMIVLPRAYFNRMAPEYHGAVNRLRTVMSDIYWADQLAVSIALASTKVPYLPLSMKFNFPNDERFDEAYPEELRDARVIHYLREDIISRTRDFESVEALRRLVNRTDLTGSHRVLQTAIAANMGILEPAPLDNAADVPWA